MADTIERNEATTMMASPPSHPTTPSSSRPNEDETTPESSRMSFKTRRTTLPSKNGAPNAAGTPPYTSSESVLRAQSDAASSSSGTPRQAPELAADELAHTGHHGATHDAPPHLDIANYPSAELLKMLAALLQHIATSNDQLRPMNSARVQEQANGGSLHTESRASSSQATLMLNDPRRPTTTTAALATLNAPSSTLCFHARHIPSISIEAYLLRILKYCPTTNDVFLSLLVYFDRMSRVGVTGAFPGDPQTEKSRPSSTEDGEAMESDPEEGAPEEVTFPGLRGFAIDSYNVHRLVIAGITVASKFFSDVFYTNARYAKVGGLAVHELNQLELHFLLLTDFRLTIPISEIQQYGDQLLAYASDRSASSTVPRPITAPETTTTDAETAV